MALKIFWTEEAISSYNKVIDYLIEYWTEREVVKFTDALTKKLGLLTSGNVTFKSSVKKKLSRNSYNKTQFIDLSN